MISKFFNREKFSPSLSSKLIITYTLLTIIPLGILSFLAYYEYTKSIENQVGEYIPKLLKQANNNIENDLREYERFLELIYSSNEVMAVLRDTTIKNQSQSQQDKFIVESFLTNTYLDNNSDILGAFILSKNRAFASSRTSYNGFNLENSPLPYGEEHAIGEEMQILLPSKAALSFEGNPPYLLLMKQITDVDNRKSLGTIFLAVNLSFIEDILLDLEEDKNASMWVMDDSGQVIFHSNSFKIGTVSTELKEYPLLNGSFQTKAYEEKTLISINQSSKLKWILVHSIPIEYLTKSTDLVRNITVFAFILLALITTIISFFLAWSVTKPIKNLGHLMQEVEQGNLNIVIPTHARDEVGVLEKSFQSMLIKIRELIQRNTSIEIRQKNAELYALQSQINPHFMYNTLQTISMAVEDGESGTVVDMVTILGRMLRYSLNNKDRLVPISHEVNHIRDYLKIQKFRFEDRVDFNIQVDLDSEAYYTPKFILQPIVENSIKYGLEKRKKLKVDIAVKAIEQDSGGIDIQFVICDNGPGISRERLSKINQNLMSDPIGKRDSGFGMLNVHSRIIIMFGEMYKLKVNSLEEKGTEIIVCIPGIQKSEISHFLLEGEMVRSDKDKDNYS